MGVGRELAAVLIRALALRRSPAIWRADKMMGWLFPGSLWSAALSCFSRSFSSRSPSCSRQLPGRN